MRRRMFLTLATTGLATGTAGCFGIGGDGDDGTGGGGGDDGIGGGGGDDATNVTGGTDATETATGTNPDITTSARTTDATETMPQTATPAAPATMTDETTITTTGRRTATVVETTEENSGGSDGGGGSGVSGRVTNVPNRLAVTERRFYSMQFSTGVRGILKNVSGSPFEYVSIRATFYDAQDTSLDIGIDFDSGLAAGAEWPFDVVYRGSPDPSQIARYTLVVDTSPV